MWLAASGGVLAMGVIPASTSPLASLIPNQWVLLIFFVRIRLYIYMCTRVMISGYTPFFDKLVIYVYMIILLVERFA